MTLHEQCTLFGIDAAGDIHRRKVERGLTEFCRFLTDGNGMKVYDAEEAVKVVLQLDPVFESATEVTDMGLTRGLHAAQNDLALFWLFAHVRSKIGEQQIYGSACYSYGTRTAIFVPMHRLPLLLAALLLTSTVYAQEEMSGGADTGPSKTWGMISVQRTWTPQENNFPNWGLSFQGFRGIGESEESRWWLGIGFMAAGVERRDVIALTFGPGVFIVGRPSLGMFAFLQGGLGASSRSGVSGFNPFSDPTMQWGGALMSGVGVSAEIIWHMRLQTAIVMNAFTMDGGRSPFGIQFGLSTGGM